MSDRDENGRFLPGNTTSSKGGAARARKLPAHKRREIARKGFRAMVEKHFGGDKTAACAWLSAAGQFALDGAARESGWLYRYPDPGPHPAHNN